MEILMTALGVNINGLSKLQPLESHWPLRVSNFINLSSDVTMCSPHPHPFVEKGWSQHRVCLSHGTRDEENHIHLAQLEARLPGSWKGKGMWTRARSLGGMCQAHEEVGEFVWRAHFWDGRRRGGLSDPHRMPGVHTPLFWPNL